MSAKNFLRAEIQGFIDNRIFSGDHLQSWAKTLEESKDI